MVSEKQLQQFVRLGFVPTPKQFANNEVWKPYKTFQAYQGNELFSKHDFVELLSPSEFRELDKAQRESQTPTDSSRKRAKNPTKRRRKDEAPWIARITAIKGVEGKNVCLLIRWMYASKYQLQEAMVRDPPDLVAPEVIMGLEDKNYDQLQSFLSVRDHADVVEFDESDPTQAAIQPDSFFYRKRLDWQEVTEETSSKKGKRGRIETFHKLIVKPIREPSCSCGEEYTPLPLQSEPSMIYCPRTECHRWHHRACLPPRIHASVELDRELIGARYYSAKALEQAPYAIQQTLRSEEEAGNNAFPTPDSTPEADDCVPADVLSYARQHVMRGDQVSGIAGNGGVVLLARDIVGTPEGKLREELIEAWRSRFGPGEDGEDWSGVGLDTSRISLKGIENASVDGVYICSSCSHPI